MQAYPCVPGIVTDIDGVLVKEKHAIPRAVNAIRFLKKPLKEIDRERFQDIEDRLPFVCLTNSGGGTERIKAEAISTILGLHEPHERLTGEEVIVNFTPLRPVMEEYRDKLVLIGGLGNLEVIAKDVGLRRFITDEEYCTLFPLLVPYGARPHEGEIIDNMRKKIAQRLEIVNEDEFNEPFQIHAVFMLNDPVKWDQGIQIICDLLSTTDGRIAHKMPVVGPENHIPVYCTNNDLNFASQFRLPRMTFGCFNATLKEVYKLLYKRELELKMYGKPERKTFEYAEKHLKSLTKMQVSNFYMIGDNPKSDIRGGNAAGWITILVKTGVFHHSEEYPNDIEDPAKYVVEDFVDAIKLICKLEDINYEWFESLKNNSL